MAPCLLLIICTGFYWKLLLTRQHTWLENPDIAYQVLPWLEFQASEWHGGRIPLWDPYLWGGQTLIGQAQPGAAYPLNWILFAMPLRDGRIRLASLHGYFVVIHFMAALFCYCLCRDLGRSRAASMIAGCAFALGGYIGATFWPQMINGAVWAPLVFLYLLRAARGLRPASSAALSGMFLGISWLSGHHQIPLYMTLAACATWLYFFYAARSRRLLSRLAALFVLFAILTSGLQTLPAYEYGRLARRWVGAAEPIGWNEKAPYTIHSQFSLGPTSLLGVAVPGLARHTDPFVAIVALTFALLGVALAWKRRPVRLFTFLAVGALLFSLGRNSLLHGAAYALLPLVEKARTPAMAVFIYQFGLCVLSSYGIDYFWTRQTKRFQRSAAVTLAAFGCFLLFLMLGLDLAGTLPDENRFAVIAMVALLLTATLYAGRRWAPVLAGGLLLIELGNVSSLIIQERKLYLRTQDLTREIKEILKPRDDFNRVAADSNTVPHNFGDVLGVDVFGGYVASLPSNLLRLGPSHPRVQEIYGVSHSIDGGAGELRMVRNPRAFPRAWVVHEAAGIRNEAEIRRILDDATFDLRRKTFLFASPPRLETCDGPDEVRLLRRTSGNLTLQAKLACRGMVVVSENYFPGWRATVDGRSAEIHEAYTAIRGVVVGPGSHVIEMEYRPASVVAGAFMTALGVLGAPLLALLDRRRRLWNHR